MKRKLIGAIIIAILLNAILPNFIYATDLDYDINTQTMDQLNYSQNGWNKYVDDGEATITTKFGSKTKPIRETFSLGAGVASAFAAIILAPVAMVSTIMTISTRKGSEMFLHNGQVVNWFTIEDTVFGDIDLFDAEYFFNQNTGNDVNTAIKANVATWYYIVRIFSLVLAALLLIYIGMKMAVSTVASEIAKYKDMLKDWVVSMVMIFTMPYLLGIIALVSSAITTFFYTVKTNLNFTGFEQSILWQAILVMVSSSGWAYVAMVIMYLVVTFYQIKFFLMYGYRLLAMGFLIVISPIVAVLYAATRTKISGKSGRSAVFSAWFKEYTINAFIQPLHAGIYLVFIVSASHIFEVAPLLAVLFFAGLSRAEKIVKNIFGMKKMSSINEMSDYFSSKKLGKMFR